VARRDRSVARQAPQLKPESPPAPHYTVSRSSAAFQREDSIGAYDLVASAMCGSHQPAAGYAGKGRPGGAMNLMMLVAMLALITMAVF
jgi:hypothetical protein